MTLFGGGRNYDPLGGLGWVYLKYNYHSGNSEWTVSCYSIKDREVTAEAYAVCFNTY